jgi:hypothetical protein
MVWLGDYAGNASHPGVMLHRDTARLGLAGTGSMVIRSAAWYKKDCADVIKIPRALFERLESAQE